MIRHITSLLLAIALFATASFAAAEESSLGKKPAPVNSNELTQQQKADGWKCLFDGKTLNGWTSKGGKATYKVDKGTILGTTIKGTPNTFLCTNDVYRNFELTFDVLLVNNELNSGVQIRSKTRNVTKGRHQGIKIYGPQVEIEKSPGQSAFIYGEHVYGDDPKAKRPGGWQSPEPGSKDPKVNQHSHFKNGKWNHFRVKAFGQRIETWLNGKKVADLIYDTKLYKKNFEGFIGLQVHSVGQRGPFQVRWKNIYVKPAKDIKAKRKSAGKINDEQAIRNIFKQYRQALLKGDGKAAAESVSASTIAQYQKYCDYAISASKKKSKDYPLLIN